MSPEVSERALEEAIERALLPTPARHGGGTQRATVSHRHRRGRREGNSDPAAAPDLEASLGFRVPHAAIPSAVRALRVSARVRLRSGWPESRWTRIPDQRKAIERYAAEHDLELARFFEGDSISGTSAVRRPAFQ